MEPVSVIAGITGILAAIVKISSSTSSLISGWKEAPTVLDGILREMTALRACLAQLEPYIQGIQTAPNSRTAAISVEQIVIATSSCVLAISELQKTLDGLRPEQALSKRTKFRWASYEKRLNNLCSRVQASTSSLNLILTVITCSTLEESRQSINELEWTLDQILRTNTDLLERISNSEPKVLQSHYAESISQSAPYDSKGASTLTIKAKVSSNSGISSENQGQYTFGLDAEVERSLHTSLAYLRADGRHSLSSLPAKSDSASKQRWSFISRFSLAQVSNLSVLSLPISSQELWNPGQYMSSIQSETSSSHGSTDGLIQDESKGDLEDSMKARPRVGWKPNLQSILNTPSTRIPGERNPTIRYARKIDASIDDAIKLSEAQKDHTVKVLLLGASEAGKSTLLKQMRLTYAHGFSLAERSEYRYIIRSNVLHAFKILREAFHDLGFDFHNQQCYKHKVSRLETQDDLEDDSTVCPGCSSAMKAMWRPSGIQQKFTLDSAWALHNNFLNCIQDQNRLASPEYLPTDDDILKGCVKTTGISETVLDSNPSGRRYHVLDVGGARSERKKWVHAFKAANIVFFVAPLSGYDQCLRENNDEIQLREAIALFESVLKTAWLSKSSFILILNKPDVLAEKLKTSPVYQHWPDYDGPSDDPQSFTDFIHKKFIDRAKAAGRAIQVHVVNLTNIDDTRQMLEKY